MSDATKSNPTQSSFRKTFKKKSVPPTAVYIMVTSSLYSALTQVREQARTENRFVWADAVCIDQTNIPERNQQVRLMRRIYGRALCTWICLGEEAEDSHLIPDLISQILSSGLVGSQLGIAVSLKSLPPEGDRTWVALNALFRRPWFSRVWIMQEAALASHAMLLCGSWQIPFDKFADAVDVDIYQSREIDEAKHSTTDLGRHQFGGLQAIRGVVQDAGCAKLLGLMRNARAGYASNPADYMYGILGIAEYADDVEIQPDYGEAVELTLRRYAKHLVMKEAGLEVISQVNRSTWHPHLPTWIPNWAAHNDNLMMWGASIEPKFKAAGSTAFEMTLCDVPEMSAFWLVVKGVMVDIIRLVGPDNRSTRGSLNGARISQLSFDLVRRYILEPEFLRRSMPSASHYQSPAEWHNAVVETLVAKENLPDLEGYDYFDCFEILLQDIPQPQEMPEKMNYDRSVLDFVSSVYGAMDWVTLAFTENGLLGRLPYGTQPGDFVCIFAGSPLPFVLRRRMEPEVGYMVLGPCYVNGIMNGELAHTLKAPALMDIVLN